MLWKTHIRISFEALRRIGVSLSSQESSRFKDGVLAPDQWKDYPHHHGKAEAIRKNLLYARKCFLQDNLLDAYFYLGVALHYIQDSYTSVVSYDSPNNRIWHQNYEQGIEDALFVVDVNNTIQYFFRNGYSQLNKYSTLVKNLSEKVEGKNATLRVATLVGEYASLQTGKPIVDLNMALKASFVVSESVLSSRGCPELVIALSQIVKEHEGLLQNTEFALSNKIVKLIQERDELRGRIVATSSITSRMKNGFFKIRAGIKNFQVSFKIREYDAQKHLLRVAKRYEKITKETVSPYLGWYNFIVPKLNFNTVASELLQFQEVAKNLGFEEGSLKNMLESGNCSVYQAGKRELLRRSELDEVLQQLRPNNIMKYPS